MLFPTHIQIMTKKQSFHHSFIFHTYTYIPIPSSAIYSIWFIDLSIVSLSRSVCILTFCVWPNKTEGGCPNTITLTTAVLESLELCGSSWMINIREHHGFGQCYQDQHLLGTPKCFENMVRSITGFHTRERAGNRWRLLQMSVTIGWYSDPMSQIRIGNGHKSINTAPVCFVNYHQSSEAKAFWRSIPQTTKLMVHWTARVPTFLKFR